MDVGNTSAENEFHLVGFTEWKDYWPLFFVFFLSIYIHTVLANITLFTLICIDFHLHTPMYFFLSNLSLLDVCSSTTTVPRTLATFIRTAKTIPFGECITQMFFFAIFGTSGVYLLAAMAYDRYVAIHFPLRYSLLMNKQMCFWLVFSCYVMSLIQSSAVISSISQLCFCASRHINHYFCDIPPLLKLACSNTTLTEILVYIFGGFVEAGSLAVIFASYSLILLSVLRIRSSKGRYKAFSTCGSHFTCVTLFYGTVVFTYMRPTSNYSKGQEWLISIVYTTVIPAANPMIYSLRNSEVKGALKKLMFGTISYNK